MLRIATCACGQVRVTCNGDPDRVTICSCTQCQKRTGSAFGVGAYFWREKVTAIEGEANIYRRTSEAGRWFSQRFCPRCGSTVYWEAEFRPEMIGIALGAFADPAFPKPHLVVWTKHKAEWVLLPEDIPHFPTQPSIPVPRATV